MKTGPKKQLPKKLGDACRTCKRTDVYFYPYSSNCKTCRTEKAASYYKERYWRDDEWKQKQITDAKSRHALNNFDICLCGAQKQVTSNLCKSCWQKPAEGCINCGMARDSYFDGNNCRTCKLDKQKVARSTPLYKSQSKEAQRERLLYKLYGLTVQDYEALLVSQNHKCAICRTSDWGPRGPQVDHDHRLKGKESVRGILCTGCNWGLGKFGDTLDGIIKAAEYLDRFESKLTTQPPRSGNGVR